MKYEKNTKTKNNKKSKKKRKNEKMVSTVRSFLTKISIFDHIFDLAILVTHSLDTSDTLISNTFLLSDADLPGQAKPSITPSNVPIRMVPQSAQVGD